MDSFKSIITTTNKQISRSGWLGLASVAVMTLAFMISTIFGIVAYAANRYLINVEQQPQIWAFFNVGTSEADILKYKSNWEKLPGVSFVEYTSEDQAKDEFYQVQKNVDEIAAEAVADRKLPSSLAIRLESLEFADNVSKVVLSAKDNDESVKQVLYSKQIVDNIREVFNLVRLGGAIIITLLVLVLILFTFLTVEFKMHNRGEEIEIMQLVGGSLGFIRMPFIIEGAYYGFMGALISNLIVTGLTVFIRLQLQNGSYLYLRELISSLKWPEVNIPTLVAMFVSLLIAGAVLGSLNSFIAIRRYIK